METTINSQNERKQLLFQTWELDGRACHCSAFLSWRGNEIRIKVYSFSAHICTGIRFEISFNREHSSRSMMYSNGTATEVTIPDVIFINHKLVIKALPKSLEIIEVCLNPDANLAQAITNQEEEYNWISITKDLKTKMLKIPHYNDDNLLSWIHRSFVRRFDVNTSLYKYELFSPDLYLIRLKIGDFTCTDISDHCQNTGGGTHGTIQFKIADCNDIVRSFRSFHQGGDGVIEMIGFMSSLKRFDDWQDYDSMDALAKSLGTTNEELDRMIAGELLDTGISFGSNE